MTTDGKRTIHRTLSHLFEKSRDLREEGPPPNNVVRINPNHPSVASEPDRQPYDQDNDGSDGEPRPVIRTYDDVGDFTRCLTVEEGHVGEVPQSPKVVRVSTFGPSRFIRVDLSPEMATQFALAVLAAATKAGE